VIGGIALISEVLMTFSYPKLEKIFKKEQVIKLSYSDTIINEKIRTNTSVAGAFG
jgi:hypothetical protein